jgi:hypothetical protein
MAGAEAAYREGPRMASAQWSLMPSVRRSGRRCRRRGCAPRLRRFATSPAPSWKYRMLRSRYTSRYGRKHFLGGFHPYRLKAVFSFPPVPQPVVAELLIPSRIRRIVRSQTPMTSAASSQLIFFDIAFKITSCTFIIRSIVLAHRSGFRHNPASRPVFVKADRSHTNDTSSRTFFTEFLDILKHHR